MRISPIPLVVLLLATCTAAAAAATQDGGVLETTCASGVDVEKFRHALHALSDEIAALGVRESALGNGTSSTSRVNALSAMLGMDLDAPRAGCASKGDLERLQKRLQAAEDRLGDLAVRLTEWEIRLAREPRADPQAIQRLELGG